MLSRASVASVATFLSLAIAPGLARGDDPAAMKKHFHRATTLYDLRRYHEAAKEYEAAFEAKNDPVLLYNIAQAYRLAGDYSDAAASYKAFLRRFPDAPNASEVIDRINDIERILDQQRKATETPPQGTLPSKTGDAAPTETSKPAPTPAPAPAPPPAAPPDHNPPAGGRSLRVAGIGVAAAGVLLLGAGLTFGLLARSAGSQLSSPTTGQRFDPAIETQGLAYQGTEIAALAVGGVAVVGGVVLLLLGRRIDREARVSLAPSLAPHQAGAALHFTF